MITRHDALISEPDGFLTKRCFSKWLDRLLSAVFSKRLCFGSGHGWMWRIQLFSNRWGFCRPSDPSLVLKGNWLAAQVGFHWACELLGVYRDETCTYIVAWTSKPDGVFWFILGQNPHGNSQEYLSKRGCSFVARFWPAFSPHEHSKLLKKTRCSRAPGTSKVSSFASQGDLFYWSSQLDLPPGMDREAAVQPLAVQMLRAVQELHDLPLGLWSIHFFDEKTVVFAWSSLKANIPNRSKQCIQSEKKGRSILRFGDSVHNGSGGLRTT